MRIYSDLFVIDSDDDEDEDQSKTDDVTKEVFEAASQAEPMLKSLMAELVKELANTLWLHMPFFRIFWLLRNAKSDIEFSAKNSKLRFEILYA